MHAHRLAAASLRASMRSAGPRRAFTSSSRRAADEAARPSGSVAPKLEGVYDNAFNRERLAVKQHAAATAEFWRKLSIYVVIPSLIAVAANTWVQWNAHWEHQSHLPPIEERPQYAYQNLRTKAYPWGDGDKTLFWNEKYNINKKDE